MNTIILAGGKSSRMGQNKALMKVGGIRVIDRIAAEFGPESDQMIVVANDPAVYKHMDAVILEDEPAFKGQGPLAGIYTGLKEVGEGPCLIVACDMPFVSAGLGRELVSILKRSDRDAVVPIHEGRMHPLLAAYDARVSDIAKKTLENGKRSVRALLDLMDVEYFTIKEEVVDVWNMNTMAEYIHAEKLLKGERKNDL